MMFAIWLEMRGTLWFEPLKIVTSPTPINSIRATSNWLSICAVNACVRRLITARLFVDFIALDRGRLLAEQIVIEHLPRNWSRCPCAEAGVFNQHSER